MPASVLRVVYLGREQRNTWGASTKTPTVKLMGLTNATVSIVPTVDTPELVGTLAPGTVAALAEIHGEGAIEQRASYQDICYWLDGIFGPATASAAANTTYTYNYIAPLTASTKATTYTVNFGTTNACYEMDGAIPNNLTIGLCAWHHRSKEGFHGMGKRGFEATYNVTERELLDMTDGLLGVAA